HVNMQDVPGSPHASSLLTLEHNSQDVALSLFTNSANDGAIYFGRTGTTDAGRIIYDHSTDTLLLGANSSANQLVLASSGRIGIGTTSPYARLSVVGETVASHFTATTTATSTFPTLSVTGRLYAGGTGGANGSVLQSTGSGVQWVATSSLGITSNAVTAIGPA